MTHKPAVDRQLPNESADLVSRFNEICDGGGTGAEGTPADLQADTLAAAIASGDLTANWKLGVDAVRQLLTAGRGRDERERGGAR